MSSRNFISPINNSVLYLFPFNSIVSKWFASWQMSSRLVGKIFYFLGYFKIAIVRSLLSSSIVNIKFMTCRLLEIAVPSPDSFMRACFPDANLDSTNHEMSMLSQSLPRSKRPKDLVSQCLVLLDIYVSAIDDSLHLHQHSIPIWNVFLLATSLAVENVSVHQLLRELFPFSNV